MCVCDVVFLCAARLVCVTLTIAAHLLCETAELWRKCRKGPKCCTHANAQKDAKGHSWQTDQLAQSACICALKLFQGRWLHINCSLGVISCLSELLLLLMGQLPKNCLGGCLCAKNVPEFCSLNRFSLGDQIVTVGSVMWFYLLIRTRAQWQCLQLR